MSSHVKTYKIPSYKYLYIMIHITGKMVFTQVHSQPIGSDVKLIKVLNAFTTFNVDPFTPGTP